MAWLIVWSFLGLLTGAKHPEWLKKVQEIAKEGDLAKFWSTYDSFIVQKTGHAHANSMACAAFLVGLAMKVEMIGFSSQFQTIVAIWMFIGVIIAGFGDRLRIVPLSAIGSTLFLTALITSFVGLFV
jgi:hypothetical protein